MSGRQPRFSRYARSPSTRLAAFAGLLTYFCYAYAHNSWKNPALIGVALFFALFMPTYTGSATRSRSGPTTSSATSPADGSAASSSSSR